MRKFTILSLMLLLSAQVYAQSETSIERRTAAHQFNAEHENRWTIGWNKERDVPGRIYGHKSRLITGTHKEIARQFLESNKAMLGIVDVDRELELVQENSDGYGAASLRYQQLYKGIPVWNGGYLLTVQKTNRQAQDGSVALVSGDYHPEIDLDIAPQLSESEARQIINSEAGPSANIDEASLVIYQHPDSSGEYVLAYKGTTELLAHPATVLIDANDGRVLMRRSLELDDREVEHARLPQNFFDAEPESDEEIASYLAAVSDLPTELTTMGAKLSETNVAQRGSEQALTVTHIANPYKSNPTRGGVSTYEYFLTNGDRCFYSPFLPERYLLDGFGITVERYSGSDTCSLPLSTTVTFSAWGVSTLSFLDVMAYYHTDLARHQFFPVMAGIDVSQQPGTVNIVTDHPTRHASVSPAISTIYYGVYDAVELNPAPKEAAVIAHEYTHLVMFGFNGSIDPFTHEGGGVSEGYADFFGIAYRQSPYSLNNFPSNATIWGEWIDKPGGKGIKRNIDNTQKYSDIWDFDGDGVVSRYDWSMVFSAALWDLYTDPDNDASTVLKLIASTLQDVDNNPTFLEVRASLIARAQMSGKPYSCTACVDDIEDAFDAHDIKEDDPDVPWSPLEDELDAGDADIVRLSKQMQLHPNYPNPFTSSTDIQFYLPASSTVSVGIFDVTGREITRILSETRLDEGTHTFRWDAQSIPSGTYFYRLTTDQSILSRPMILLK